MSTKIDTWRYSGDFFVHIEEDLKGKDIQNDAIKLIRQTLTIIDRNSTVNPPIVSLMSRKANGKDLLETFSAEKARVLVDMANKTLNLDNIVWEFGDPTTLLTKISSSQDKAYSWMDGNGVTGSVHRVPNEYNLVLRAIHDVFLDIVMANTLLYGSANNNISNIRNFLECKCQHLIQKAEHTIDGEPKYISLASNCWYDNNFKIQKYLKLWFEILDECKFDRTLSGSSNQYKHMEQLPRDLQKKINTSPEGTWIIANWRMNKRTTKKDNIRKILNSNKTKVTQAAEVFTFEEFQERISEFAGLAPEVEFYKYIVKGDE